jgi:hypothetical protein
MSLVFAAWLSVAATSPGVLAAGVNDEGGFFSPGAVEKAEAKIDEIRRDYGKGMLIDTVANVPENQQAKYNELGKKDFFVAWARQRAEEARAKGIYILICRKPAHVQVEIDRATRANAFTADDRERLLKRMIPLLREKQNDAALLQTVDLVAATLRANLGRRAAVAGGATRGENVARHGGGSSWGWIGIIALVALGGWLLMGVLRGASGMGGGPGFGGGGGGGGGFFTSLLGGMFGAATPEEAAISAMTAAGVAAGILASPKIQAAETLEAAISVAGTSGAAIRAAATLVKGATKTPPHLFSPRARRLAWRRPRRGCRWISSGPTTCRAPAT